MRLSPCTSRRHGDRATDPTQVPLQEFHANPRRAHFDPGRSEKVRPTISAMAVASGCAIQSGAGSRRPAGSEPKRPRHRHPGVRRGALKQRQRETAPRSSSRRRPPRRLRRKLPRRARPRSVQPVRHTTERGELTRGHCRGRDRRRHQDRRWHHRPGGRGNSFGPTHRKAAAYHIGTGPACTLQKRGLAASCAGSPGPSANTRPSVGPWPCAQSETWRSPCRGLARRSRSAEAPPRRASRVQDARAIRSGIARCPSPRQGPAQSCHPVRSGDRDRHARHHRPPCRRSARG
jgi:hypothetical protein